MSYKTAEELLKDIENDNDQMETKMIYYQDHNLKHEAAAIRLQIEGLDIARRKLRQFVHYNK